MLFQGRLDRARRLQRRQSGLAEEEEEQREALEPERPEPQIELERGDFFAMLVAALYTVFLPAAGLLALVAGISYLLFFH